RALAAGTAGARQRRSRPLPSGHERRIPGAHGRSDRGLTVAVLEDPRRSRNTRPHVPAAADWLARFERHLATERRLSRHPVGAYLHELEALVAWCRKAGVRDWTRVTHEQLRSFAARSHAAGLSARSVQR